ncbi:putative E3 ubiquitin-protein ligase HERC3 [Nibea albiflora]|uniref:E3 ubiquitin-protein ligase HERC3 n=1 Tax=Nibea albiflora TaxID=240163 RepID=A0ACB7FKB2_NIBAL|nr:putative E3 ubiquitin-protein ligase HERC3 [Nibea albiflora]
MLCWGNAKDGQLGTGLERNPAFEPKSCHVFSGRGLKEVACGWQHSMFLLQDGSVYTCGSGCCGQLGHDKAGTSPELVGALDTQKIIVVSCGRAHSMAVNEQGQVFAWGAGEGGQLGLGTAEAAVRIPRLVKRLCDHRISQVMCGNQHCIALSRDGQLFTWGQNTSGQLGLGKGEPSKLFPHPLKSLAGIPLAKITAGGDHSFALSLSGAVFGWGKNKAGQLGLNDKQGNNQLPNGVTFRAAAFLNQNAVAVVFAHVSPHKLAPVNNTATLLRLFMFSTSSDRAVPCHIKFLRSQKVVHISCGDEHTAALTKDGGLFTFGDGSWGQLGHGSTNNELLPRRVLELMGTEVSQITCGRHHTLAFVPSSGVVYAFGCNSHGQLGTGILGDARSPFPIKASFLTGNFNRTVTSLFSSPLRLVGTPASWTKDSLHVITLIGFFLSDDAHFKTNPKIPGIDLNSVRMLFATLSKPAFSGLLEQATKSFESLLIPQLPRSPPDVEAMRIYLILSEYPALQDSKNYIRLTIPLAMAILRLDANPSKITGGVSWTAGVFTRMVDMYKSIVVFMLTGGKTLLVPVFYENYFVATLRLLEKLHKVNLKARHVEYNRFYIPDITNLVDIQEDYLKWFLSKAEISDFPSVNLCAYPFILNAQAKTTMLQTDAELQMQMAVSGANLHNVFMLLTLEPHLARNPYLVLHVRRDHLVIFDGEEAVDAGGVTKEFFLLLLKELMDPVYGMFTHYKESNLLWFSDKCFVEQNWFHLIGIICGLAIYNSTVVDLHFPLALYKKLLDVTPTLEDFKELSPTEARSLQQLLDYEGGDVEETFLLNFAITRDNYGMTEVKELIPGGESISVDKNNSDIDYTRPQRVVGRAVSTCLAAAAAAAAEQMDSVSEQYLAFSSGFLKVCGGEILSLFQPSELMAMVVGNNNYNWEEMEKNAVYKGEYSATHPTVRLFWEVFHEFPLEKKKQFLLFLTGSDRIPIHGMESLRIVIQSTTAEEDYLPVAHTCYNLLDMPRYQTKEILRRRLTQAVEQYEGFSLV